jgi:hypothetical protein
MSCSDEKKYSPAYNIIFKTRFYYILIIKRMTPTFTHEQLIRYIYNDCTAEERQSIGRAICDNAELAAAFLEMKNIYNRLNTERYEPSQTSLDIIMQHVSSAVHH